MPTGKRGKMNKSWHDLFCWFCAALCIAGYFAESWWLVLAGMALAFALLLSEKGEVLHWIVARNQRRQVMFQSQKVDLKPSETPAFLRREGGREKFAEAFRAGRQIFSKGRQGSPVEGKQGEECVTVAVGVAHRAQEVQHSHH